MLKFIIGFFIGGFAGIFTMCMCAVAKDRDTFKEMEEKDNGYEEID